MANIRVHANDEVWNNCIRETVKEYLRWEEKHGRMGLRTQKRKIICAGK